MSWNIQERFPEFKFWFSTESCLYYKYRANEYLYFVIEITDSNGTADMITPKLEEGEFKQCVIEDNQYECDCVCANIFQTDNEIVKSQMEKYIK